MTQLPIYLDYAATTPVDPRVFHKMQTYLSPDHHYGNAAASHHYGKKAKEAIEEAREQIAQYFSAESSEIIFTSGATESNNLALKGAARLYQQRGKHVITMKTEHKSVLNTCQHLEKEGYRVTYLAPQKNGLLDLEVLQNAICKDTILVSIMSVNNETGVIQDIAKIAAITSARGILFHVDDAQGAGKIRIDLQRIPIDLLSACAHKIYGPQGIGILYLRKRPRVRVQALFHGGGQEQGMRSGTLATHQIAGMAEAFRLISMADENEKINVLRDRLLAGLSSIENIKANVNIEHCVPHIINLRFDGMQAQAVLAHSPIAASIGAACISSETNGSYVLRAMGLNEDQVNASVRLSIGRFTTTDDIDRTIAIIRNLFSSAK